MESQDQGHKLFRRAIVEREEDAWAAIYACYRPLLIAWATRSSLRPAHAESGADIADRALARAWAALTPERFAAFSTLGQLLAYLRACVATAAIDCARAQTQHDLLAQRQPAHAAASPEQVVLADLDRAALWHMALEQAATPAERIALIESFAYGLPPRAIQAHHPQLFPDVAAVYAAKRCLLDRLRRNHGLLRLREVLISW
jgi:hypothetical protein